MPELPFTLLFSSPAFLNGPQRGTKKVAYVKSVQGVQTRKEDDVPYFPLDERGVRIPSLRGMLEFWYRSLLGHLPSEEVFREQGKVFGSVDHGQGLTIRPVGRPKIVGAPLDYTGPDIFSLIYMGYGPLQLLKRPRGMSTASDSFAASYHSKQCRDVLRTEDDKRPRFRFVARGRQDQIDALKKALILLHLFGGLGARSRRGWGSVEVEADCVDRLAKGDDAVEWFRRQLGKVWVGKKATSGVPKPRFSAFSDHTCIGLTAPIPGDPEDVILDFFRRLESVRSWHKRTAIAQRDHSREMKDAGRSSGPLSGVPERLAFGMPYFPESRKNHWKIEYRGWLPGRAGPSEDDVKRRASPLILKVLRLSTGQRMGVALFLDAEFFGDPRMEIGAIAQGPLGTLPFPGYGAVTEFFGGRWEATLP
jgi:CRISPR-associated protein Cmr1